MTKDEKFLINVFVTFVITMAVLNLFESKNKKDGQK